MNCLLVVHVFLLPLNTKWQMTHTTRMYKSTQLHYLHFLLSQQTFHLGFHTLIAMIHFLIRKTCPLQLNRQIHFNPMKWNPPHLFQQILMPELKLKKLDSFYIYQILHQHLQLIGLLQAFHLSMSTTQKDFFPWLFQPRIHEVDMHEYALHLIHYHDNRFGQHPRFRYYIYNVIMLHRSNATASVFVKTNLEDTLPSTILELVNQL